MNAIVAFPTPAEQAFGEQFRALREAGAADESRERAYAAFSAAGLPHRRIEAWHYTDLRSTLREVLPRASAPSRTAIEETRSFLATHPGLGGTRFVLIDGFFVPDLSATAAPGAGVSFASSVDPAGRDALGPEVLAAEKLGAGESVAALNAALLQTGLSIRIAPGSKVEAPIEILSVVSHEAKAIYTRSYVDLGAHASATVVERHVALGAAKSQGHHVLVFAVGDGSALEHVAKLDALGTETLHVGSLMARIGAEARLLSTTLVSTGGMTRRQSFIEFVGEGSQAHCRGLSLLDGRCHADSTLLVTHTAPHCESREFYKHVLDDEATGVYQGKVVVAPGAQKTDGKMLSKAVFLADGATMFNKPELEIFADDVVCGHGATVGSLDETQLFYLRARGIPLAEAQAMLLEAFADEAIEDIGLEDLRTEFAETVGQWLRRRGA